MARIEKALPVHIYKHKGQDSSNGGISSRYDEILLLNPDGYVEVDLDMPPENLCVYVRRVLFGNEEHDYIEPYAPVSESSVGYMDGGTICDSCDSRFQGKHPVPLHDRQETQKQYDSLSH